MWPDKNHPTQQQSRHWHLHCAEQMLENFRTETYGGKVCDLFSAVRWRWLICGVGITSGVFFHAETFGLHIFRRLFLEYFFNLVIKITQLDSVRSSFWSYWAGELRFDPNTVAGYLGHRQLTVEPGPDSSPCCGSTDEASKLDPGINLFRYRIEISLAHVRVVVFLCYCT